MTGLKAVWCYEALKVDKITSARLSPQAIQPLQTPHLPHFLEQFQSNLSDIEF